MLLTFLLCSSVLVSSRLAKVKLIVSYTVGIDCQFYQQNMNVVLFYDAFHQIVVLQSEDIEDVEVILTSVIKAFVPCWPKVMQSFCAVTLLHKAF